MVMVYAGGHVSGAHYNPAVTLGVWIRGAIKQKEALAYIVTQLVAGCAAAHTGLFLLQELGRGTIETAGAFDFTVGTLAEFLGTFALVWVVLNVATAKANKNNSFYGLAIGFTVMAGAFIFGPITGGAFNPAVALSISAIGLTSWTNITAFLVGQVLAGSAAGLIFKQVNPKG